MITAAAIISLACLAVPVGMQLRIWFTWRATCAEIHARMSGYRLANGQAHHPTTNEQDAAPSAKTTAAPCHPATSNDNEVPTS